MGSPLGLSLANSFLCHYKKNGWIIVWSNLDLWYTKECWCLTFTSAAENDNSFSFLEIKINRYEQQFKTPGYRNLAFSGAFMHYKSYLDKTYKKSLIDTSLIRWFLIFSHYTLFHLETENLREILIRNSYPWEIIEQSINFFETNFIFQKSNPNCS